MSEINGDEQQVMTAPIKPKRNEKRELTPQEKKKKKAFNDARNMIVHTTIPEPSTQVQIKEAIVLLITDGDWGTCSWPVKKAISSVTSVLKPLIVTEDDVIYCLKFWRATREYPYRAIVNIHGHFRFIKLDQKIPDINYLTRCFEDLIPLIEGLVAECRKDRASFNQGVILSYASQIQTAHKHLQYYAEEIGEQITQ